MENKPTLSEVIVSEYLHLASLDKTTKKIIFKCMDEYAEQQCIAFKYWYNNHAWEYDYREQKTHTTKELYKLFIKEQNSKV
jgi:hypothetical protein